MSYKSLERTILEITSVEEAAQDLGTIHVIHHPTKGYRQKGGGYSKEINRKTKTFKSHDSAAKSDNNGLHYQHHKADDGKQHTSLHPSTNRGTRVHTVNTATGEIKKGDSLHNHQAKAAVKVAKQSNSDHHPYRAGKTHADDIPKHKRFNHATNKGHYVENKEFTMSLQEYYATYISKQMKNYIGEGDLNELDNILLDMSDNDLIKLAEGPFSPVGKFMMKRKLAKSRRDNYKKSDSLKDYSSSAKLRGDNKTASMADKRRGDAEKQAGRAHDALTRLNRP